jgi:excisionase family DNA binding protein
MTRPTLITTDEFAAVVRLDPSKVRQRIRRGEIKAVNVGTEKRHIWRITEAELDRYLSAGAAMSATDNRTTTRTSVRRSA